MNQRRNYNTNRPHRRSSNGEHHRGHENGGSDYRAERSEKPVQSFDPHFPPATLLQEYEYATDGAANKLLDMAKEEQQHRFAREVAEDRFNKKTIRISQFFGAVAFLVILVETFMLFSEGKEQMGLILFFGACGTGLLAALITASCSNGSSHKSGRACASSAKQEVKAIAPSTRSVSESSGASQPSRSSYNSNHQNGGYRGNGDNRRRHDRSRNRRRSPRPEGGNGGRQSAEGRQGQ